MNVIARRNAWTRSVRHWKCLLALTLPLGLAGCDSQSGTIGDTPEAAVGEDSESVIAAEKIVPADSGPAIAAQTPSAPAKQSLSVGDPAPPLHLAKFLKGEPVDTLSPSDRVHVIEFWATWCGPCRVGMPHISELQQHHGDLVAFVGVTREDEATVQSFLAKEGPDGKTWDEVIQYRIALDDASQTNDHYMRAAG